MPRDAFVLKIQRELCHPKYARKVSGLSRNRPQAPAERSINWDREFVAELTNLNKKTKSLRHSREKIEQTKENNERKTCPALLLAWKSPIDHDISSVFRRAKTSQERLFVSVFFLSCIHYFRNLIIREVTFDF